MAPEPVPEEDVEMDPMGVEHNDSPPPPPAAEAAESDSSDRSLLSILTTTWKPVVGFAAVMIGVLAVCYCAGRRYHLFGWGLSEAELLQQWDPRTLPPIQQSPPWSTWRNRTRHRGLPRILQWTADAAIGRRSAVAFPSNRDTSFGRLVNVSACTTPSKLGSRRRQCVVTGNRNYLYESDAVVFCEEHLNLFHLPNQRAVPQMWVFWVRSWPPPSEPPLFLTVDAVKTLFNWTMSRREDSNVRIQSTLWGFNSSLEQAAGDKNQGRLNKKRREVAWIASEREQERARKKLYILSPDNSSEATNRVKLHILTRCAHTQCWSSGDCMRRIAPAYHFVLVERSPDCYESAYEVIYAAFEYDIVPVVLTPPDATLDVPPHSVVSSAKLQQPGQLATFLRVLMDDATKYESFFAWKREYHLVALPDPMCPLCAALWEQPMRPGDRLDLKEWHKHHGSSPNDKPFFGLDDSFEEAEYED